MGQIRTFDGRYQLEEVISAGSFSTVYRALDRQSGNPVALKIIAPRLRESRLDVFLRLQHEAVILARLNHPAIVPIDYVGQSDGQFYLVTRYIPASTLATLLAESSVVRRGCISPPDGVQSSVIELVKQLADALSHVHAQGIIHRDIKPSNILVLESPDGPQVRLIDFGLAQLRRLRYEQTEETEEANISSAAAYLSPEQTGLLNWPIDSRSDLYSLGIVFYQMLSGQLPFKADNLSGLLHQHLARRPPSLCQINPAISPAIEQIVMKLLAKNPDERYQSALGLLADLQRCSDPQDCPDFVPGMSDLRTGPLTAGALVGRKTELAELRGALAQSCGGQGQVIVLSGPSGMGKSRLVETLAEPLALAGGFFLRGKSGLPDDAVSLPYKPFGDIVSAYVDRLQTLPEAERQTRRDQLRRQLNLLGPQIFSVAPALRALFENEAEPTLALAAVPEPERQENRFRAMLADFLFELATPAHPLVLLLDDLQWADQSSLALLNTLIARLEQGYFLLALCYRSETPALQQLFAASSVSNRVQRLKLSGLGSSEVTALLENLLGPEDTTYSQVCSELGGRLYRLSQGNPLFVQEAVKTLVRQGTVKYSSQGWYYVADHPANLILPANAAEILLQRLDELPAATRHFFACAAVLGHNFTFEHLQTLLKNASSTEIIQWLEMGLREQFLFETPDQPGCYGFSHDKIREAFYTALSPAERRNLHEIAGLTLEADHSGSVYNLATHFLQSDNAERAARYAVLAGNLAEQTYAYGDAALYYEKALAHAPRPGQTNPYVDFDELRENLANAYVCLRKYDEAEKLYQRLIKEAKTASRLARYEQKLSNALFLQGDLAAAVEHLEQALRLLGENRPRHKSGLVWSVVKQGLIQARHSLHIAPFVPREKMRPEQLDALLIYSRSNFMLLYEMLRGADIHLRALNLVERFDVPEERTRLYAEHGLLTAAVGWQRRSRQYLERAEILANRYDDKLALVYVYLFRGMAAFFRGDYRTCLVWIEQALPIAKTLEVLGVLQLLHNQQAACYFNLADLPNANATLKIQAALTRGLDDTFDINFMQPAIELLNGNLEQAEVQAERLLQKARQMHLTIVEILMEANLAQITLEAGRAEEARRHASQAVELVRRHSFRLEQVMLVYPCLAETYLATVSGRGEVSSPNSPDPDLITKGGETPPLPKLRRGAKGGETLELRRMVREALSRTRFFPNHQAYAWRVAGQVAWAEGETKEAEKCWRKSLNVAQRLGQRYEEARTYYEIGKSIGGAMSHSFDRGEGKLIGGAMSHTSDSHKPDSQKSDSQGLLAKVTRERGRDYLRRAFLLFREIGATRYLEKIIRLAPGAASETSIQTEPAATLPDEANLHRELVRQRRLAGLVEVGREISAILDLDQLLERILTVVMEVLGAERGFVLLYGEDGQLNIRLARSLNQDLTTERETLNLSVIREVEQSGEPLLIEDARTDPRFSNQLGLNSEVRSVVCVPLVGRVQSIGGAMSYNSDKGEGKSIGGAMSHNQNGRACMGFLYADNRLIDNLFRGEDEHLLTLFNAFGGQAAIAIENARLFTAEQEALRQKEATLVELQIKNEKLQQATEMLLDDDADLRSIVSEQLHNVLKHRTSQLQSQLQQLQRQLNKAEAAPPEREQLVAPLQRMLATVRELSDGLRSTQMLVEDAFHRRTLGLLMHLRQAVEDLENLHAESPIRVSCQLAVLEELLGPSPERLEESELGSRLCDVIASAVTQALLNAYDHSEATEVSVVSAKDGSYLSIAVIDNGRGFEVAAMPAHTRSLRKLIRKAELLGGEIIITSAPGQGTRLELRLPLTKVEAVMGELK